MLLKKRISNKFITLTRTKLEDKEVWWCHACKYWDKNFSAEEHQTCRHCYQPNHKIFTIYDQCFVLITKAKVLFKPDLNFVYVIKEI